MKKLKNGNGITLIALIITIIVMLILVGVTINVSLNGGLFEKAKNAAEGTQKKADIEVLQSAAVAAYNTDTNEVNFRVLTEEALKLGFTGAEGTYSKNNVTYKVNKTSAKVEEDGEGEDETSLEGEYTITAVDFLNAMGAKHGKYVLDNGNFYAKLYVQGENNQDVEIITGTGTYTVITDTDNYKKCSLTYTENENTINSDLEIFILKNGNNIINKALWIPSLPLVSATSNGIAGLNLPDESIIGSYENSNHSSIIIALNNDSTKGKITSQENSCEAMFLEKNNKIMVFASSYLATPYLHYVNDTLILTIGNENYTKVNN